MFNDYELLGRCIAHELLYKAKDKVRSMSIAYDPTMRKVKRLGYYAWLEQEDGGVIAFAYDIPFECEEELYLSIPLETVDKIASLRTKRVFSSFAEVANKNNIPNSFFYNGLPECVT